MPYFVVFSLIEAQNSKKTASQIGSYFVVFSLIAVKNNWFFYWRGSRNTQVWNPGSATDVQQVHAKFKLQRAGVISEGKSNSRAPGIPATTPAALDLDVTSKYETAWLLAL